MTRPPCVVNIWDLPGEKRPRFTSTPGVAAVVRTVSDAVGLTQMGATIRVVEPGFAGTNRHFHSYEEEWAYVLAGHGTVRIGPLRIPVSRGHFVGFPPGPRPHHFLAERETLVLLEGGDRRPDDDNCWYPDLRKYMVGRKFVEPYVEPPPEEGDERQAVHVDEIAVTEFRHDVDRQVRRSMRRLSADMGFRRQAVAWARVPEGGDSTVMHTHDRTDEWILVLSGRATVRVGAEPFVVGPNDFLGHPAGGPAHVMHADEELTYLVGGQRDSSDIVTYPEHGLLRAGGVLHRL